MKRFFSPSNASWMSPGFLAASVRRPLTILPFLAPALCKLRATQNMVRSVFKPTAVPNPWKSTTPNPKTRTVRAALPGPYPPKRKSNLKPKITQVAPPGSYPQNRKPKPKIVQAAPPGSYPQNRKPKPRPGIPQAAPPGSYPPSRKPKPRPEIAQAAPPGSYPQNWKSKLKPKIAQAAPPGSYPPSRKPKPRPEIAQAAPPGSYPQNRKPKPKPGIPQAAPPGSYPPNRKPKPRPEIAQAAPPGSYPQNWKSKLKPKIAQAAPPGSYPQNRKPKPGPKVAQAAPPGSYPQNRKPKPRPEIAQAAPPGSYPQNRKPISRLNIPQAAPPGSYPQNRKPKPKPKPKIARVAPPRSYPQNRKPKPKPKVAQADPPGSYQKPKPRPRVALSKFALQKRKLELEPRTVYVGHARKNLGSGPWPVMKLELARRCWPKPENVVRPFAQKKRRYGKKHKLKSKSNFVPRGPLLRWLKLDNRRRSHIKLAPVHWVHKKMYRPQMRDWIGREVLASIRRGAVAEGHYLRYLEGGGNPDIQYNKIEGLKKLEESITEGDEDVGEDQLLKGNGNLNLQDEEKKGPSIFEQWIVDEAVERGERGEQTLYTVSEIFRSYAKRRLRGILTFILSEGKDSRSMAKVWSTLDQKERRHEFRYIAGHLLRRKYTKFCTRFLECCCLHNPHPPTPEDVALVLEYIIQWELRKHRNMYMKKKAMVWQQQKEERATRLINLMLALLRVDYGGAFPLKQSTIHRLTRSSCLEDVSRLYDGLQEAKIVLTTDTMLHFINRLSDLSTWTKAHSIMDLLSRDQSRNLHSPQVWKAFQTLFYNATFIGEEESSTIVRMMLRRNINPGLSSYNILLTKASRNQDEQSLMRIFRQMLESGLRPSMVTYGLLHKHYKEQGAEAERFQVMKDAMKLDSNLNVILATDILHAKVMNSSSYLPILDEYLDFFTPTLLVSLGIATPEHNIILQSSTQGARFEPDHVTIAMMVHAFCMYERDPMAVWAAYQRYQRILKTEKSRERLDPLYGAGPYMPNAYMLALGRHEDTLWHCATILEDMLKPNSPIKANEYSWSILLYAMVKAQKMEQAEQVLGAMRRKGIEPNVVTWTSLLTGYVRIGRLWQAGEVMRRMTAEKVEPNHATMGLLASIIDSKELTRGMAGETMNEGGQIKDILGQIQGQKKVL